MSKVAAASDRRALLVLVGSVALLFVSGGGMYLIVVALKEVAMEFGWPRSVPSFAFAMQYVGSGLGGIVMGYVLDRFGFIVPALVGAVMVGLGGILASGIDAAWQLYLIYLVMFGLSGQGSLAAPALANIARWYERRRGMAVGIVSSGQALAGIVWPPVFGYAMAAIGWRDMFFWFGVFAMAVMLPLCLLVRHRPPAYVPPPPIAPAEDDAISPPLLPAVPKMSTKSIQVNLCCAIIGCCVAMALPLGHLVSFISDRGFTLEESVEVFSVTLMAAFFSRAVVLGLLSDKIGGLWSLFVFAGIQALTLGLFTQVYDLWLFYVVAVIYGLGYGGIFPIYAVAVRDHLPITQAGRRTGLIFMFGAVAMGFGGWMGGYLFDLTGSYTLPFLIGVAFNLVNLVIIGRMIHRIRPLSQARIRT
jgi:MFS family permease